jgi:hypothetical protein
LEDNCRSLLILEGRRDPLSGSRIRLLVSKVIKPRHNHASRLQSTRLVAAVAELGSLGIMRALQFITFFFLAAAAHAIEVTLPPEPTAQEKQFISAVERAFATTNIAALTAMDHVVGMPHEALAAINGPFYRSIVERGCRRINLARVDPAKETEHKSPTGSTVRESLPVRWIITVHHPSPIAGGTVTTEIRAGLLDGQIRFTQSEEKK